MVRCFNNRSVITTLSQCLLKIAIAAHGSSPATASALLRELNASQPMLVDRLIKSIPDMFPKAYRWVGEMEEISEFVGEGEGEIHRGLANLYRRIEGSLGDGDVGGDVGVLTQFVAEAKATRADAAADL